jgi:MoaA/NifB/PqqE/SkfB family radical SAM enzyme
LKCLSTLKVEKKSQFPWVILHQPINRYNLKNIEAMIDLAQRTQCNALSFGPFLSHRGKLAQLALSQSEEKLLFTSLTKMGKRLNSISMHHNINKTLKRYRIGEAVWDKFPCYIGWLHARIKVDGTVFPCGPYNLPLGHLKKNSLHEIWNGPGYQTFRQQTLSREGLASIGEDSDCGFCCLLEDNIRVYRIFRFFSPFLPWLKKSKNRFKGDVLK